MIDSVIYDLECLLSHEEFDPDTTKQEKNLILDEIQSLLDELNSLATRFDNLSKWNFSEINDAEYLELLANHESTEIS